MSSKAHAKKNPSWDIERLSSILDSFSKKTILIVGDIGIDRYVTGDVERISPEAPVPIVRVQNVAYKLGLAANVADNVKSLGGVPLLVGVIGDDADGVLFKKLMAREGISTSGIVKDAGRKTTVKERIVSDRQQLIRLDYEDADKLSEKAQAACERVMASYISKSSSIIIEDYAKGVISRKIVQSAVFLAKKSKQEVLVDPNAKTPLSAYRGVTLIRPNTKEAEALSGVPSSSRTFLSDAAKSIYAGSGVRHVLVTRGKDGMAICKKDGSCMMIPTIAREVYDVSGAGDTVMAVLSLARAGGATLEESAILANIAAGIEVGKRGTATVTVDEIREALGALSE